MFVINYCYWFLALKPTVHHSDHVYSIFLTLYRSNLTRHMECFTHVGYVENISHNTAAQHITI